MKELHLKAIRTLEAIEFTKSLLDQAIQNRVKYVAVFGVWEDKGIKRKEKRIKRLKECYRDTCNLINVKNHDKLKTL